MGVLGGAADLQWVCVCLCMFVCACVLLHVSVGGWMHKYVLVHASVLTCVCVCVCLFVLISSLFHSLNPILTSSQISQVLFSHADNPSPSDIPRGSGLSVLSLLFLSIILGFFLKEFSSYLYKHMTHKCIHSQCTHCSLPSLYYYFCIKSCSKYFMQTSKHKTADLHLHLDDKMNPVNIKKKKMLKNTSLLNSDVYWAPAYSPVYTYFQTCYPPATCHIHFSGY